MSVNLLFEKRMNRMDAVSGAGGLPRRAMRRAIGLLPPRWRAVLLLATIVLLFPVIVGVMILASVTEELPLVRQLWGAPHSEDGSKV
jgi:hypothetical protein